MADTDHGPDEERSRNSRFSPDLLGLDSESSGFVLLFVAIFAPGLAILAYGAAVELSGSWLPGAAAALLGFGAGLLTVRDFLRWRPSLPGALLALACVALIAIAYL